MMATSLKLVHEPQFELQIKILFSLWPIREEGHRRRPHEPEVVAMGDEEASGEEVWILNNLGF